MIKGALETCPLGSFKALGGAASEPVIRDVWYLSKVGESVLGLHLVFPQSADPFLSKI